MLPLLDLPEREVLRVLGEMDNLGKLAFSLLSKRTHALIKSVNLERIKNLELFLTANNNYIRVYPTHHDWYAVSPHHFQPGPPREIQDKMDGAVVVLPGLQGFIWRNTVHMSILDWILHVLDIYNTPNGINKLHLGFSRFSMGRNGFLDVEKIREILEGLHVHVLCLTPEERFHGISTRLVPARRLFLSENPFREPQEVQKLFIQNRDIVEVAYKLPLDDLLCCNSKTIICNVPSFTVRQANTFFKQWIRGGNPNLTYFKFRGPISREMFHGIALMANYSELFRRYGGGVSSRGFTFWRADRRAYVFVHDRRERPTGTIWIIMHVRHLF